MPYRILALDGGGSRALIPVSLLQRMQESRADLLPSVDLFAGTSTSAITALILADSDHPGDSLDMARLLWVQGKKLFSENTLRTMSAAMGASAYFDNDALSAALEKIFGKRKIGDLKRKVVIPSVTLGDKRGPAEGRRWRPLLIQNFDNTFSEMSLVEAGLRATATPILFPVRNNHIDGALLANNPALCAISQAIESAKVCLDGLVVLSVGAGENPIGIKAGNADWGYADWLFDYELPLGLMQAVAETNGSLTDYQCQQLLKAERYYRLNPLLSKVWLMHEHSARFVVEAGDVADSVEIKPVVDWFNKSGWFAK